jgi:tetratricopeptide (TPR) repeat protein
MKIATRLRSFRDVRVVSRTSATNYHGEERGDVREIGKALGAMYAVEGSVRRDESNLRITVQLVNAGTAITSIHSHSIFHPKARPMSSRRLSQSVTQVLRTWLSPELIRQWQARGPDSREAFGYFVRARAYGHEGTPDGDAQAEELYRLAIERDPRFALAYVGLAEVKLSTISSRELKIVDVSDEVRLLLGTAEKLNADMPELVAAKGWFAIERKAYDEAEQLLLEAIARNPGDAVVNGRLGNLYESLGRPRDALARFTRAAELDPLYFVYPMYRCLMLQDLGQNDEAARACTRTRILTRDNHWGAFITAWLEMGRGNLLQALHWSTEAANLEPGQAAPAFFRIEVMLMLRLVEQAREALRQIVTTDEARMQLMRAERGARRAWTGGLARLSGRFGDRRHCRALGGRGCDAALSRRGRSQECAPGPRRAARRAGYQEIDCMTCAGARRALIRTDLRGVLLASEERAEGLRLLDGLDACSIACEEERLGKPGTRLASCPVARAARAARCCDAILQRAVARAGAALDGADRPYLRRCGSAKTSSP